MMRPFLNDLLKRTFSDNAMNLGNLPEILFIRLPLVVAFGVAASLSVLLLNPVIRRLCRCRPSRILSAVVPRTLPRLSEVRDSESSSCCSMEALIESLSVEIRRVPKRRLWRSSRLASLMRVHSINELFHRFVHFLDYVQRSASVVSVICSVGAAESAAAAKPVS